MNIRLFVRYSVFLLIATLALTACNVRQDTSLFNTPSDIVTDTLKGVYVVNDQGLGDFYRIKPEDQLILRNLQDKDFLIEAKAKEQNIATTSENISSLPQFEVDQQGFVTVPVVGKVQVAGLTRREVTRKMQDLFEASQTNNAIIDVVIINLKVTLLGEFAKQGNYVLQRDNITLTELLADAGGVLASADPKTLKIFRGNRANPEIIHVNLNNYKSLGDKKLILQNNDLIVIQQLKSVAATTKLQNINNFVQPFLVLLNVALLIFTITK